MRVVKGWSGEIQGNWHKEYVDLDETDLRRLFIEAELPPELAAEIPTTRAFGILEAEAERMILAALLMRYPARFMDDANKQQLGKLAKARNDMLAQVRADAR